MKTYFYKILYKNKEVVYVGVTTRTINERFREHLISKSLSGDYSVIEFDYIEHPEISSLEVFYNERLKVVKLEQKYIKEELDKGSNLLNISAGGEWGYNILDKLRREEFLSEFGSYDSYKEYKKGKGKSKKLIYHWIFNKSKNKSKALISHWISHRGESKTKVWLKSWISNRSESKSKRLVNDWISNRCRNRSKRIISDWISNKSKSKSKRLVNNWIFNRSISKSRRLIGNWIIHRKTKAEHLTQI